MRVEKHNAHGMQLLITVTPAEALLLIEKLSKAVGLTIASERDGHYFGQPCLFEDDNEKWVETDFDVVVTRDYEAWSAGLSKCIPAYPEKT